ncbi:MAG: metalloregulator ArsR/SmtB family transcription factor [Patescibacteria group bacterium]
MHRVQNVRKLGIIRKERYVGLARLFFAAADPARIKIMLRLGQRGEACVSDIARELGMSVAATSHHLRILQSCRCLHTVRSGKMVCYKFSPNAFSNMVIRFLHKTAS